MTSSLDSNGATRITLTAQAEKGSIRQSGDELAALFQVHVAEAAAVENAARSPLNLALVVDRSGSMSGDKIVTAKRAALAVLERLQERDQVALVVFDDRIDTLQRAAPVTPSLRAAVKRALDGVEARANTALHEGWLTGCQAIAADQTGGVPGAVSRCFLLTDGLANVGLADPERIAGEAAEVRERAGIGTSTFGIGADYDERLLGPMAVAGGGQFHHLRSAEEIARTFVGELGDMLSIAASRVGLEIEASPGVRVDLVSLYWLRAEGGDVVRWTLGVGDLAAGETRQVVIRARFPAQHLLDEHLLRVRLVWQDRRGEQRSDWQTLRFQYAQDDACASEPTNPHVAHWAGLHQAERARRDATERSRQGDLSGAKQILDQAIAGLAAAPDDQELQDAKRALEAFTPSITAAPAAPMVAKEAAYQSYRTSRGQKDHR